MRNYWMAIPVCGLIICLAVGLRTYSRSAPTNDQTASRTLLLKYKPWKNIDVSGMQILTQRQHRSPEDASLEQVAAAWRGLAPHVIADLERETTATGLAGSALLERQVQKAVVLFSEGKAEEVYDYLSQIRSQIANDDALASDWLYSLIYMQGVAALRIGENENCIMCRGESSCIFPIEPAAVHTEPRGSRLAVKHFGEYLAQFPDDLGARWLINIAHMTLGEHPSKVDPRYLLEFDSFKKSEFDIGRFRDVGHLVGVNHLNQAGGAIMDDFDNDGLFDLVLTEWDPRRPMTVFHNRGDGVFDDRSKKAGLEGQLGGLYCVQTDYDNDGLKDVLVVRGAWTHQPLRPSLLHNKGDGTFEDVTKKAGLDDPMNSISAQWADFDNDGWLDVFICGELQPSKLYRNRGDGTFENVASKSEFDIATEFESKGCTWIDYDNDDYPDLFVNNLTGYAELYHNNKDGTFSNVNSQLKIKGPLHGFSCWSFDFDNDGWLDIFATCYDRTLSATVNGILGRPHQINTGRLYRNVEGQRFDDVTAKTQLEGAYAAMGSNFGDFDNDGFIDFYLATGEPSLSFLVPNRMFKNVEGLRFSEITGSSRTGHLQKGHAVAIGDWDRDGDQDLFVETGGAIDGDRYHDVLFQNPGQGNHWLSIKLVGKKTNRAAIGARIKAVPVGDNAGPVHNTVCSGSSFGANPLEQHIGLGKADKIALLEIHWPTSGTTQVFHNIDADQILEITEFASDYRVLPAKRVPDPLATSSAKK